MPGARLSHLGIYLQALRAKGANSDVGFLRRLGRGERSGIHRHLRYILNVFKIFQGDFVS